MNQALLNSLPLTLLGLAATAAAQQSAQVFEAPVIVVPDDQQRMNALLDLNGDGWMDAVGTFWHDRDEVGAFAFLNDGAGKLEPFFEFHWTQYGDPDFPFPIATADINGDGWDDFVTCCRDEMQVFLSQGNAAPILLHDVYLGSGNEGKDIALGDYDGDGVVEAALRMGSAGGSSDRGIRIYDDLFAGPTIVTTQTPAAGTGFTIKNIDGDGNGRMDLLCLGERADIFKLNISDWLVRIGSFDPGMGALTGAAGDVDGDGDQDVALFEASGSYCVLRRQGPASFVMEAVATGGPATGLADVDGDGDLDGVCCGGGGGGPSRWYNNSAAKFEISINDGSGTFAPSFKLHSFGANKIAGVADIDHDGDADLIAGRIVYYNVDGFGPVPLEEREEYIWPYAIRDVDGDGDPDARPAWSSIERNNGRGKLKEGGAVVPRLAPNVEFEDSGIQADFDGDGDVDVIVAKLVDGTFVEQRLLRNTGAGGLTDGGAVLAPGQLFRDPAGYGDTFYGDLNGDGRLDIVTGQWQPSLLTKIFTQEPDGTFVLVVGLAGEHARAMADVDGDGFDDLLLLTFNDVLLRYGAPTAAESVLQSWLDPSGSYLLQPGALAEDLDGDGDIDLLVPVHTPTQSIAKVVRVLENVGPRQYTIRDDVFPDYVGFLSPALTGDMDGDGTADVVLGQPVNLLGNNTILGNRTYLGAGGGVLDFTNAGGETYPLYWMMADQDGDGDLDAYTNSGRLLGNHAGDGGGVRVQYGKGTRGAGGQVPVLGASGPFAPGETVLVRITGAAPNSTGVLLIGKEKPRLGLTTFGPPTPVVQPIITVPFAATSASGEWGSGAFTLEVRIPQSVGGKTLYHQVIVVDPAAEGGLAFSNILEIRYAE